LTFDQYINANLIFQPKAYRLVLVMSDDPATPLLCGNANTGYFGNNTFVEYSYDFLVAGAPRGGTVVASPTNGTVVETSFRFFTQGWSCYHDCSKAPFEYRFAQYLDSSWTYFTNWQTNSSTGFVIFGEVGNETIGAQAKDYLGSVSNWSTTVIRLAQIPFTNASALVTQLNDKISTCLTIMCKISGSQAVATVVQKHQANPGASPTPGVAPTPAPLSAMKLRSKR
jgi:hypothetical protein